MLDYGCSRWMCCISTPSKLIPFKNHPFHFTLFCCFPFLGSGGTSTGAVVAGWLTMFLCRQNRFGDFVLTREARLAPGATIRVYRDKAAVQVYNSRSITGPSKLCKKTNTSQNVLCLSC